MAFDSHFAWAQTSPVYKVLKGTLLCVYNRQIDTETIFIAVTLQFYQEA